MKYSHNQDLIKYMQTEDSGNALIMMENNQRLMLNSTGVEIIEMLPNFNSTDEILANMRNLYPQINSDVLKFDVEEILRIFEIYGLIVIHEDVNETNSESVKFAIAGDINYKKINKFILGALQTNAVKYCQETDESYYSPINMRLRVVGNSEYGVFAIENGVVKSYMSIACSSTGISAVLVVSSLFFCVDSSEKNMFKYLVGMINRITRIITARRQINKIRIAFFDNKKDDTLIKLLERIGFVHECCLEEETTLGNMNFYSYFLHRHKS